MGDSTDLNIDFSSVGDLLSIWARGPSKGGGYFVTLRPHIDTFYSDADASDKHCVGIYWFDARRILSPVLEWGDMSEVEKYPELLVDYSPDADVLVFGNREESVRSEEMAEGLTAHLGPEGLANRFTLERASVILMRHFRNPIDRDDNAVAAIAANETEV